MERKNIVEYNQIAAQNLHRLEALSDGVFAIAMTLLVLDLKVPTHDLVHSEGDLWIVLRASTPKFVSYLLGFMTLGIFWTGQSTQFSLTEHSNRAFAWWHIGFLMFISLLPFSTAFLSEFYAYRSAVFIYWLNILGSGLMLLFALRYADRHGLLKPEERKLGHVKVMYTRIYSAQMLYVLGVLLCLFSIYISIGFILLIQICYVLGLTFWERKRK